MTHPLHHHTSGRSGDRPYFSLRVQKVIDRCMYVGGSVTPLVTLPQVTKIWIHKNAEGVSLFSWAAYAIGSLFFVVYGIAHRQKPIVYIYSILFFVELLVVAGVVRYGS